MVERLGEYVWLLDQAGLPAIARAVRAPADLLGVDAAEAGSRRESCAETPAAARGNPGSRGAGRGHPGKEPIELGALGGGELAAILQPAPCVAPFKLGSSFCSIRRILSMACRSQRLPARERHRDSQCGIPLPRGI